MEHQLKYMDKTAIIPDKATALEIIGYMHTTLYKHGVKPCQIALFGSFLHGNNHAESDLDMIIISEAFEGRNLSERIYMTMNAEKKSENNTLFPWIS